ncbi:hypothetical protein MYX77_05530 [Acidobacteriia bacterium AH_259_A11_L15]|nr:hypothetical protein [Acidobacteriia bacterium AH_259_A11_L15]
MCLGPPETTHTIAGKSTAVGYDIWRKIDVPICRGCQKQEFKRRLILFGVFVFIPFAIAFVGMALDNATMIFLGILGGVLAAFILLWVLREITGPANFGAFDRIHFRNKTYQKLVEELNPGLYPALRKTPKNG